MDYQQVPVPIPGTDTWQPQLARPCTVAIGVLNSHVNNRGRCAACGSDWPCGRAVLAGHDLILCNDTGVLRPPETVSRRRRCRSRTRPETAGSADSGRSGQLCSHAKQATMRWGAT